MADIKICRDCRWAVPDQLPSYMDSYPEENRENMRWRNAHCRHPKVVEIDIVSGEQNAPYCSTARRGDPLMTLLFDSACGVRARYFSPNKATP